MKSVNDVLKKLFSQKFTLGELSNILTEIRILKKEFDCKTELNTYIKKSEILNFYKNYNDFEDLKLSLISNFIFCINFIDNKNSIDYIVNFLNSYSDLIELLLNKKLLKVTKFYIENNIEKIDVQVIAVDTQADDNYGINFKLSEVYTSFYSISEINKYIKNHNFKCKINTNCFYKKVLESNKFLTNLLLLNSFNEDYLSNNFESIFIYTAKNESIKDLFKYFNNKVLSKICFKNKKSFLIKNFIEINKNTFIDKFLKVENRDLKFISTFLPDEFSNYVSSEISNL